MTLVRKRRHQQALSLSLPAPPPPAADHQQQQLRCHRRPNRYTPASPTTSPPPPDIETLPHLKKLTVLGHGNGGIVYKVRHHKSNSIFALKVLHYANHHHRHQVEEEEEEIIATTTHDRDHDHDHEAEILKRVDSQFIVKCHAVFYNGEGELCFVMEHMERGSLFDVLRVRKCLPEDAISAVAYRVLLGLRYIHGLQIIHGDIKPSNLLINGKGEVKIADFGVSRIVGGTRNNNSNNNNNAGIGTCAYMSPERVDSERWGGDYGFAGDVWSLGVVALECFVGHYPLIGLGEKPDSVALICAICFRERLELPESASQEFCGFVMSCLEKDWRKRGTVEELLVHPFVNKKSSDSGSGTEELII